MHLLSCQNDLKSVMNKIEKVPRGIQGEKSSKDTTSTGKVVSTIGALASPKKGDGTRNGKRSLPHKLYHV